MESQPYMVELLERHRLFWELEQVEQPLVCFSGEGVFFLQPFIDLGLQEGLLFPEQIPPPQAFESYYDRGAAITSTSGDMIWVQHPPRAIPWMEAIAGCHVVMTPEAGTITPVKQSGQPADAPSLEVLADNPWRRSLMAFTRWLSQRYGESFPVGQSLMRGPADMMLALLGSQAFYTGFYDDAQRACRLANECTELWIEVLQQQYACMATFASGYGAGVLGLWAPGQVAVYQEDAAGLVSPAIYRKFFLDCDAMIANAFDYSLIHLHSASLQILDLVLQIPALTAVNVVIDPQGPDLKALLPAFLRIQQTHKALHIQGKMTSEQRAWLTSALSPVGLCIYILKD